MPTLYSAGHTSQNRKKKEKGTKRGEGRDTEKEYGPVSTEGISGSGDMCSLSALPNSLHNARKSISTLSVKWGYSITHKGIMKLNK